VGRAATAAVSAAVENGAEAGSASDHEDPDPFGAAEFVGTDRHEIGRSGHDGDVEPGHGGNGVGVEHGPRRPLPDEGRHLGQRLDRPHLVVGEHDGDDPDAGVEGVAEGVQVDGPRGVDGDGGAAHGAAGQQDGMVLDGRAEDGAAGDGMGAEDGQIVRLGPPGGEHDLARLAPERGGDVVAGVVDGLPGGPGHGVAPRRVPEVLGQVGQHGGHGLGAHGRRRRVVQIRAHHLKGRAV